MAELCVLYGQNEEGMVGELVAFCTSTQRDHLTLETLSSFEREVRAQSKETLVLCRAGSTTRCWECELWDQNRLPVPVGAWTNDSMSLSLSSLFCQWF